MDLLSYCRHLTRTGRVTDGTTGGGCGFSSFGASEGAFGERGRRAVVDGGCTHAGLGSADVGLLRKALLILIQHEVFEILNTRLLSRRNQNVEDFQQR